MTPNDQLTILTKALYDAQVKRSVIAGDLYLSESDVSKANSDLDTYVMEMFGGNDGTTT